MRPEGDNGKAGLWKYHVRFVQRPISLDKPEISIYLSWNKNFTDLAKKYIQVITKTSLLKYTENFTTKKWKFSDKNSDIFHISAQNKDCGYSLEPPWLCFWAEIRKIMYTPANPSFII